MKCLVTGGAGFIGSHLAEALIEKGHDVVVLDNLSTGNLRNVPKKAKFIRADIQDDLEKLLKEQKIDYVFHLAADASVRRSFNDTLENANTNIIGALNIIDFCVKKKVKKIVFSSSAAVYSPEAKMPITEESKIGPISPYGITKRTIENYLESMKSAKGLDYVILRYSNVYGPRQNPTGEAGVISIFVNNALIGNPINIFGDGKQTRDFIFVKDVVSANIRAMNIKSGIYNISSGKETAINELAKNIASALKSSSKIEHLPEISGELRRSLLLTKKISSFGWKQKYDLDSGLNETINWMKENSAMLNADKSKKRKKILEVCVFSAGGCGVFARVKQESQILAKKGYEVRIFSSNFTKGSDEIAPAYDRIGDILIRRFPAKKIGGESFSYFNYANEALKFKPDAIIVHSYRHIHTLKALGIAKKIGAKAYLVTHAPFAREGFRKGFQNKIVWAYDKFFSPFYIKRFSKIIAISNWELPYLKSLGLPKQKIDYIPNGIPPEFFSMKKSEKEQNKIFFLGRVSPIKRMEVVIRALPLLKDKKIVFEIAGPQEEEYANYLKNLIKKEKLEKRIIFTPPIYDIEAKIKKIDSARFCILPSQSEGMPQGLVEYMARSKITIGSDNLGNADIIKDGKNGFLFKVDDYKDLARVMNKILDMKTEEMDRIKGDSLESVRGFAWDKVILKIEKLI